MESNKVRRLAPLTRLAHNQRLRWQPANYAGCGVIPLCNTSGATVQLKEFMRSIQSADWTKVILPAFDCYLAFAVRERTSVFRSEHGAADLGNSKPFFRGHILPFVRSAIWQFSCVHERTEECKIEGHNSQSLFCQNADGYQPFNEEGGP